MEKATKKFSRAKPVNPEERWIRFQEIGLAQFFAIPVALMLGVMFLRFNFMMLVLISLVLAASGYCFFMRGHEKRKEIHNNCLKKKIAQNTHNEQ